MYTKLVKHGEDLAVVIDQPLLDSLGITADTPLDVSVNGSALVIAPAKGQKLDVSLEKINYRFGNDLERLAESENIAVDNSKET